MGSLIKFELKKIVTRRVFQASLAVLLAMLCYILFSNISSQHALDPDEVGGELEGTAAIAQMKRNAYALAGPITDDKATEALREYKTFIDPEEGEIKDEYRADRGEAGVDAAQYWDFVSTHGAYMTFLTRPWMTGFQMPATVAATIDTSQTVDLYGQIRVKIESQLEDTQGTFSYTAAEREFWLGKADGVPTPVEYGYAGGWEEFLNLGQFLVLALIVVVIACASTFNVEYREKTDAVLLSTKFGRTRLGKAKVAAAIIVSTCVYWVMVLTLLIVPLGFFGADGAGLPLQAMNLTSTYDMSLSATALAFCLIGYLATLGLLGIVLACSARMRSSMGILAIGMVIVVAPALLPNLHNNIASHVLAVFPYLSLNPADLFGMVSYSLGPIVIEYPVVLAVFYALLFIAGSLLAMRSFKGHQVA